ncbi:MAG TPA: ECF-type sigma factor, partial [Bryobacteraceae bacterium]|nr:ECF-type sigma factor [Bryobacteraceae bacterium]
MDAGKGEITQLLERWQRGDDGAVEGLAPLVYGRLHAIAEAYLHNERPDHTLQPTAVVNEVFLDLLHVRRVSLKDRAHFFAFAARLTRRVLIDSARKAKSEKRGAGWQRAPLDAELAWLGGESDQTLD